MNTNPWHIQIAGRSWCTLTGKEIGFAEDLFMASDLRKVPVNGEKLHIACEQPSIEAAEVIVGFLKSHGLDAVIVKGRCRQRSSGEEY